MARRPISFGNGYLSSCSSPAGSQLYSDTLLPLNSYLYVPYYTETFPVVNRISTIY